MRLNRPHLLPGAVVLAVAVTVTVTGCSGTTSSKSAGIIRVVASTNVWGAIAAQVGGDHVAVTSFISDPSQDPHSYEANTQNQLAVKKADLVIENGGGYDDFMATMVKAAENANAPVLNAVTISGRTAPAGGDLNEHVWYDLPTVTKVANQIAATLSSLDKSNADEFTANASAFAASLTPITDQIASIRQKHAGAPIAITEPVPGYLLDAAGLTNKTPEEFSKAIEEGTDMAPAVLDETLKLFSSKQVQALVYNQQTTGVATEAAKKAASDAQIPVVPVTETMPDGKTYAMWMQNQVGALAVALDTSHQ